MTLNTIISIVGEIELTSCGCLVTHINHGKLTKWFITATLRCLRMEGICQISQSSAREMGGNFVYAHKETSNLVQVDSTLHLSHECFISIMTWIPCFYFLVLNQLTRCPQLYSWMNASLSHGWARLARPILECCQSKLHNISVCKRLHSGKATQKKRHNQIKLISTSNTLPGKQITHAINVFLRKLLCFLKFAKHYRTSLPYIDIFF